MNEKRAKEVGEQLARRADAESAWSMATALMEFPSTGNDVWVEDKEPLAHWCDDNALLTAQAESDGGLRVKARPIARGAWSFEVDYRWDELGNIVKHSGLRTTWRFRLPIDEEFSINGEIVTSHNQPSKPDDAEQLARRLAVRMLSATS